MIDLQELLFKRFKEDKLAHFYILNSPSSIERPSEFLKEWIESFLVNVLTHSRGFSPDDARRVLSLGHSDILVVEKESPDDGYKVDDFNEFLRFQNFGNFELPHRFVIIHNAHNITETISNKLLKTLEEPQDGTTIFFLNPTNKHFLKTIESRAISLSIFTQRERIVGNDEFIAKESSAEWILQKLENSDAGKDLLGPLANYLEDKKSIGDLLAAVKTSKKNQNLLFSAMLDWQRAHISSYAEKAESLDEITKFIKAAQYNNPASERFFNLITAFFAQ